MATAIKNFWTSLRDPHLRNNLLLPPLLQKELAASSCTKSAPASNGSSPELLSSLKTMLFAISLALNLAAFVIWFMSPSYKEHSSTVQIPDFGWTRAASEAAERAASHDCNGHGDLYVDTFYSSNDTDVLCECYECFAGPQCAQAISDCDANVDSGDPLLFAPYWKQNAEASAILIPGWYRMSYVVVEGSAYSPLTPTLEQEIRALHALVGNAVTEGRYILLGTGSMQLLNAAVASLSPNSGDPASVVSAVPYYGAYQDQTEMFETAHYMWAGDANLYALQEGVSNRSSIEFVTSPNNPDAIVREAVLNGSEALSIFDLAYYWPHFTAITSAADHDVMLFTLSKVTGHAGSRIGWAIVKDISVYKKLLQYVQTNIIGVAHDSQLRATQLLRTINKGYSNLYPFERPLLAFPPAQYAQEQHIFHYAYAKLRYRWKRLSQTFKGSKRFTLQHLEPKYCTFFNAISGPSPAYAWVRCEKGDEEDCPTVFRKAGIIGREGSAFGATDRHIRLSLLKRDSNFENLIDHLTALVSES